MSLKIKNSNGEWVVDQRAIQTTILDLEGNFESTNVEGALRELAGRKTRSSDELEAIPALSLTYIPTILSVFVRYVPDTFMLLLP